MTTDSNHLPDSLHDSPEVLPAEMSETRPLYWSIRRELWENRSVYLAPLIVAAVVLFASLISVLTLPRRMRSLPNDVPARHALVVKPFNLAPAPIMLTAFLVGIFYSLDALYGERRDRSILFWKSLPVSDRTTVAAKACIPLVVLPSIAFVLSLVTLAVLFFFSSVIVVLSGLNPVSLWAEVPLIQEPLVMIYGLAVHTLWFAPIYAWLLLVSVWSRRTPVLWAALPPFAILIVERIVFGTRYFANMLGYRVTGAMKEAFGMTLQGGHRSSVDELSQLTPGKFLLAPGLWVGLLFAAACLIAAVRLRRNREPI